MRISYDDLEEHKTLISHFISEGYQLMRDEVITEGKFLTFEIPTSTADEKIADLEIENAMLQMSMMEMTMYAATQDARLQGQEQAILELSMLVAGGGL